ncbi:nuclear transport factor 2 family protein [Paraurantiacibacter namhicola]|uniref:SnoaL-like domain protein n=1 Tax=Paraurantiacibacter namhicola TaxID=645517 RepID=A0A1C7D4G5_9SPHN|nr:nuclear transport factor 2 family protein [Paraurantiacibacter namhicola]ANU06339.1 SnoaL-like domain protein [Paraurantiacibacter namhicola]
MSTPEPVETAKRLYAAFAAGDMDAIAAMLGDDVRWIEAEGGPYEKSNPHIGFEGVLNGVFAPILGEYDDFAATPERFTSEGNRVVSEGRYTGMHKATGAKLNAQFVHSFEMDGDRIKAMQQYTDTYQWRSHAGE